MTPATTDTVLMVQPLDFGFNPETARDNEFQHEPTTTEEETRRQAMNEFILAVDMLSQAGVTVVIPPYDPLEDPTPDAVFPNNWLSTRADGTLITYPMVAANRQLEVSRLETVKRMLHEMGFTIEKVRELHPLAAQNLILEGTGSLVIDHEHQTLYAARSKRTDERVLEAYAKEFGYRLVAFDTQSSTGLPYYHTNVVLSLGPAWAVVCADAIAPSQRDHVLSALREHHEVLEISYEQTERYFCANVLELKSDIGERLLALSHTAWEGFTPAQQAWLERFMIPVICPIPTIEAVGGGSLRCMLAEVFLPKA